MTEPTKAPARRATPARPKPKMGEVRMEYMNLAVPEGEALKIPYRTDGPEPPEVQVLSVDKVEGHGQANWVNVWNVVVIWRS
jgi:hypothetical protein